MRVLRGSGRRADQGARALVCRPATRAHGFRRASSRWKERFAMSGDQSTREHAAPAAGGRTFDADLDFLSRWAAPLGLLARAMLAYIFIVEGAEKITSYAGVVRLYAGQRRRRAAAAAGHPRPSSAAACWCSFGLKTRWAAIALSGYCLLTALILPPRRGPDDRIPQEHRDGRRLPCAGDLGPRRVVAGRLARASPLGTPESGRPFGLASWPRAAALPCGGPRRGL